MTKNNLRPKFWQTYPLNELNDCEWEALCDGCGVCCLIKYLDEEDVALTEYTDVACRLLDCTTGHCRDYAKRKTYVPDCIRLTYQMIEGMLWLPSHCAYKRLYLGKDLPSWHYLLAGDDAHKKGVAKVSVAGRCVSEDLFNEEEIENRVVRWVKI